MADDTPAAGLVAREVRPLLLAAGAHPRGLLHLSAASGLVRIGQRLFVVADDEHHLGGFDLDDPAAPLRLHRLREGDLAASAAERKARKPDLEVLLHLPPSAAGGHGALLALGSGSGPQRHTAMLLPLDSRGEPAGPVQALSLEPLYRPLRASMLELNIEGGFVEDAEHLVLLQRGNRRGAPNTTPNAAPNAALHYRMSDVRAWLAGAATALAPAVPPQVFDLGTADGVALAFTDGAALSGGRWVFSAVAEDSADSWADGACVGAAIGVVDAMGRIETIRPLAQAWKIEGIAALEQADGAIELLMVTDADDPAVPAMLLSARLEN